MIVLKFGGIALQNKKMRAYTIQHIDKSIKKYKKVVVVVSAMGRSGNPYATDSLISLTDAFSYNAKAKDLVASCGEIIAASVLSAELSLAGIHNKILTGKGTGILTEGKFGNASIKSIQPLSIHHALKECHCIIIPGFQGENEDGEMMTLGRGGSDLTAVALGVALHSPHVQLFKDVAGIFTEDPKMSTTFKKIDHLTYDELLLLMKDSHPIIQKRAVQLAKKEKIPLYVRGIQTSETGTKVSYS